MIWVLTSALLGTVLLAGAAAQASVSQPGCDALETWAAEVDPKDRWYINPASKRFWLPSAFHGEAFDRLFGQPAEAWSLEDVEAIKALLIDCAKQAQKARRPAAQKALTGSRGFVANNLKRFLAQAERDSRKIAAALDALLALPDSPRLLRALALLRRIEAGNKDALAQSQRQISTVGGDEAKAARPIIAEARGLTPEAFAAKAAARIEARYQELRSAYLEQAAARLAALPAGPRGLAGLESELKRVSDELGEGLSAQDYTHLETLARERRAALRQGILDDAKARIDALPTETRAIAAAGEIVAKTSPSLDTRSRNELETYARSRQRALAREILEAAESKIDRFPATLDGIDDLDRHVETSLAQVAGLVEESAIHGFESTAARRRSASAKEALSEFTGLIAGLAGDQSGLAGLSVEVAKVDDWDGVTADVRKAYHQAAEKRRAEIQAAMASAKAERAKARQGAIVARTKSRIDALPARFRSLDEIPALVEDARDGGLDPAALAEVESHAESRRRAIADEILGVAAAKLEESLEDFPDTIEGLADLMAMVDIVVESTSVAASDSALRDFETTAVERSSEKARKLEDTFEAELAALSEDRRGLLNAQQAVKWVESWRHVGESVRDGYLAAARGRRDEIASRVAASEAERREKINSGGGDPELVGYTFLEPVSQASLKFRDEARVTYAIFGLTIAGTYRISGDQILVNGPSGTQIFERQGNVLISGSLSFRRVE